MVDASDPAAAASDRCATAGASDQGLTLDHSSDQDQSLLWDTLGGFRPGRKPGASLCM